MPGMLTRERALIHYVLIPAALLAVGLGCAGDGASRTPAESANSQASATAGTPESGGSSAGAEGRSSATASRTILFVGTSLTAGYGLDPDSAYPQLVQQKIDSAGLRYTVINAGVSGETSSSLLRRLDWLLRQPFAIIVVETGANDGLRGIPIETMRTNIARIIARIQATRPDARIVLAQMEAPPNLGTSYTRRFRSVFPELASATGATLLPFLLEGVAGERDLNQADGIHPNMAGERVVAENVWKGLRPLLN